MNRTITACIDPSQHNNLPRKRHIINSLALLCPLPFFSLLILNPLLKNPLINLDKQQSTKHTKNADKQAQVEEVIKSVGLIVDYTGCVVVQGSDYLAEEEHQAESDGKLVGSEPEAHYHVLEDCLTVAEPEDEAADHTVVIALLLKTCD